MTDQVAVSLGMAVAVRNSLRLDPASTRQFVGLALVSIYSIYYSIFIYIVYYSILLFIYYIVYLCFKVVLVFFVLSCEYMHVLYWYTGLYLVLLLQIA